MVSKDLCPEKALIFRIVHKDNLDSVLANGCLSRATAQKIGSYVEIGNQELIGKRSTRSVPCEPFGTLSDYVPFYFTPFTPMLYNIKTGYGVPQKPMSDILILVSSLHTLNSGGTSFVFTDRHAYLRTAQFSNDLSDLDWIIWDVLQRRDFSKSDVDRFEKYQAEALVFQRLPLELLHGIMCYNSSVKTSVEQRVSSIGAEVKVVANANWYL